MRSSYLTFPSAHVCRERIMITPVFPCSILNKMVVPRLYYPYFNKMGRLGWREGRIHPDVTASTALGWEVYIWRPFFCLQSSSRQTHCSSAQPTSARELPAIHRTALLASTLDWPSALGLPQARKCWRGRFILLDVIAFAKKRKYIYI